jgi:thiol-disulfide isomerase/thioredoxin
MKTRLKKTMKFKLQFLGLLLTFISCSNITDKSTSISVNLEINSHNNPFGTNSIALNYENYTTKDFKGIINKDSSYVMFFNTINNRVLKKGLKDGLIKQEVADTLSTKFYVLSGYNNGKQHYIVDINKNKDFSDDELIEFDKNISNKPVHSKSFKINKLEVTKLEENIFFKQTAYLQFIPDPNYFTYKNETKQEKFKHSLQLKVRYNGFLYGNFVIDNRKFGIGVKKGWRGYEFILKNADSTFYKNNHQLYAKYQLKDTVKLNDKYYQIDSLSNYPYQLTINEINVEGQVYGFRTGEVSKNYNVKDLKGNSKTLKKLASDKGLLLLDFWGTWCGPCKELTPDLIKLHKKFNKKVQFASLAFELDPKPVLDYTIKNNMNWFNGIIKGKPKSGDMSSAVIGGLRIECYPTFIILDSDLNILFRTCGGGNNFSKLKEFLNSKFE